MSDKTTTKSGLETPAGYNGGKSPTSKEMNAPVKQYPGASKLGHDRPKGLIEGPCDGKY